ncbi:MAG: HEAT repeat domain-containing protein [Acidobacteria bacterium]|nr:HEAT repeat domain-containing protein [Acidobacteriota bacterium]MBV9624449.1 HEAT repeat domain-containing protein [Acidobacteriota bacterium]
MMNCEWVKQNIVFYVYDELADDARHELEQHVARCNQCSVELEAVKKFHAAVAQFPIEEPGPGLLAASRMRLEESLESAEQGGWWHRLIFDPVAWLNQIRFAPALAAALLIAGFAGGIAATYKILAPTAAEQGTGSQGAKRVSLASISGISSVSQSSPNQVTIQYETVSPQEARGSLGDPEIQQLLLYAARNNFNPGVRMDSVNLLTQQPVSPHVREALLYSLRYDSNTGVRLKALDALGPYVKDDVQVRDAVLESLMSDANPGIRIEALRLLQPVRGDSSVRIVLERLAAKDENRYIRSEARTMVAQMPEMN